jgi:hypothetical protein
MAAWRAREVGLRTTWKRIEQPPHPTVPAAAQRVEMLNGKLGRSQQSP